jgi:hypothetical protein
VKDREVASMAERESNARLKHDVGGPKGRRFDSPPDALLSFTPVCFRIIIRFIAYAFKR